MRLLVEVVIEPDGENCFHVYSPASRGVHIDGSTEAEALDRVKDALRVYLDAMVRHDEPLPLGPHCVVADDDYHPNKTYGAPAGLDGAKFLYPVQFGVQPFRESTSSAM